MTLASLLSSASFLLLLGCGGATDGPTRGDVCTEIVAPLCDKLAEPSCSPAGNSSFIATACFQMYMDECCGMNCDKTSTAQPEQIHRCSEKIDLLDCAQIQAAGFPAYCGTVILQKSG